jgi:hypothetical protein
MSPNRTFVLQVVAVAVLIGIVYLAFLRPTDDGELAGIEAPGGDGPALVAPGPEHKKAKDPSDARDSRGANARDSSRAGAARSGLGPASGSELPPVGGPADDQYTDTATALMEQIKAPSSGVAR